MLNEAFDANSTKDAALSKLAAIVRADETEAVIEMYSDAAMASGASFSETRKAIARARCKTCADIASSGFGPSHDGSRHCESGSIASGGTVAHCTCDTCF